MRAQSVRYPNVYFGRLLEMIDCRKTVRGRFQRFFLLFIRGVYNVFVRYRLSKNVTLAFDQRFKYGC